VPGGINLLTRASVVLPEDDRTRRAIQTELGSALMRAGDFDRADSVLTEALEAASAAGDRRLELRTEIERQFFREFTKPEGSADEILGVTDRVIPLLQELDDDLGLSKAWWLRSEADVRACRWGARADALERALEHARRAGDAQEEATIVSLLAQALYYGPTQVEDAIRRCETFLEQAGEERSVLAAMQSTLAGLRAMQGDFAQARRLWSEAEAVYDDLGLRLRRVVRSLIAAEVESLAENVDGAVEGLSAAYDAATEMHARSVSATIAAFLADALCDKQSHAEAERFSEVTEREAGGDDLVAQVLWRSSRARALAERGSGAAADALAREAVRLAEPTDFPDLRARALLAHAAVLAAAGRPAEATELRHRAGALYEGKGNVVAARKATHLAASLRRE
jgi:ATP/maltotriose-dependent transcriptional regulator MalT